MKATEQKEVTSKQKKIEKFCNKSKRCQYRHFD